jgi:cytochrome c-type biogenesis protein CcmH
MTHLSRIRSALWALRVAGIGLVFLFAAGAAAVEPNERLADPALEARARAIGAELRCLVCQNESIDESGADLAHDIRTLVRKRLTAGDSNEAAVQAVVDRYGSFVLLRPPVERSTWVLWYGPAAMVVIGLIGAAVWLRGAVRLETPRPLTDEEKRHLQQMVRDDPA